MRPLYRLLSAGQVALGLIHVAATAMIYDRLSARAIWFASAGVAIALTGSLNLLRQTYGDAATGVRRVAFAANGALAILAVLGGVATAASPAQWATMAALTAGPGALSLMRSAQSPAPVRA